jgi:hypothetical protein
MVRGSKIVRPGNSRGYGGKKYGIRHRILEEGNRDTQLSRDGELSYSTRRINMRVEREITTDEIQ